MEASLTNPLLEKLSITSSTGLAGHASFHKAGCASFNVCVLYSWALAKTADMSPTVMPQASMGLRLLGNEKSSINSMRRSKASREGMGKLGEGNAMSGMGSLERMASRALLSGHMTASATESAPLMILLTVVEKVLRYGSGRRT